MKKHFYFFLAFAAIGMAGACAFSACNQAHAQSEPVVEFDTLKVSDQHMSFITGEEYDFMSFTNHEGDEVAWAIRFAEDGDTIAISAELYCELFNAYHSHGQLPRYRYSCTVENDSLVVDSKEEVLECHSGKHEMKRLEVQMYSRLQMN